ncbi:MAG TPA: ATP-dependent Clp protease proteolytic subunit [Candidatus Micrarchaeaceae archaeon]|nr:ATP-dependent Clp protease proteolytic subunit [Candidatus Micrarchaeaceae archaeon]
MPWKTDAVKGGRPAADSPPSPGDFRQSPLGEYLDTRMFEQRVIWIRGPLDDQAATVAATQLMTLDGSGDDKIQLHLNSGEGTLSAALTLMETILALGVPVEGICSGRAEGAALGVLALAPYRWASLHSRLRLHDDELVVAGSAAAMLQELNQHQRQLERFVELVAKATGQPAERVEIDLADGRYFDLEEAIDYHLIDGIWQGGTPSRG